MTAAVITLVPTSLVSHAAGSQSGHFIMEMDRDRDGTVSRAEFLHYSSRTFKRLDASRTFNRLDRNHNGSLDPDELRSWSRHGSRKSSTQRR
jgi:Ca2+-binding EF-hand superfamily protein